MNPNHGDPESIDVLAAIEEASQEQIPSVSPHHAAIVQRAEQVKRYVPENRRAGFVSALNEIATRGQAHPGELGELGPNAARCGRIGAALDKVYGDIERLTTRLKLAEASRLILEDSGTRAVDDAYEESTRRIARGVLPPDSYANVRRHGEAHGESIIQGRARAQKVRARKAKAPKADPTTAVKVTSDVTPANDVSAQNKTGTHDA